MAADEQIGLGQCYVDGQLYFTTGGPSGSSGLWVTSTAGVEPLDELLQRHPDAVPPGLRSLLKAQGTKAENLAARAQVRWRSPSRDAFCGELRACDAKAIYLRLRDFIARYHWTSDPANYDLLTTWVMASYLFTVADAVPNLHLLGDPDTGKSRVCEIIERVSFKPIMVTDTTPAALFRQLALIRGVVLLDEQDGMRDPLLRAVLRASYRASGSVFRCDKGIPTELRCFAPKLLITNTALTDQALATRFIPYRCERAPKPVDKLLDRLVGAEVADLRDSLHVFGLTSAREVASRYATHPHVEGVSNRDEELGCLLWAVAACIDDQPGPVLGVHEKLVTMIGVLSADRERGRSLDGEGSVLRLIVRNFIAQHGTEQVDGYPGYYLLDDFLIYSNRSRELERPIPNSRLASEKLRRHGLLVDKRRVRILIPENGHVTGLPRTSAEKSIQRTAIRFAEGTIQSTTNEEENPQ